MWQYVEDLTAALKDPEVFFEALKAKGELDLKEVSDKPEVFLGGSIERDSDGTLAWGAKRYIASCLKDIEREKGELPHKKNAPLPENTHPELDTSPLLNEKDKSRYQSLIGMLQWIVTLGRFDIAGAVMTMSGFRVMPREAHLHHAHHIFGYLRKYNDGAIRFRTGIPPLEQSFKPVKKEWEKQTGLWRCHGRDPDQCTASKGQTRTHVRLVGRQFVPRLHRWPFCT